MKNSIKWICGVLALVILVGGAYFLYGKLSNEYSPDIALDNAEQENENESYAVPDFVVADADGKAVRLSDKKGKPVVVNFWASWCPPCKAEMPDFEKMYKECGEDIEFMMVNMTDGNQETLTKAKKHISENGYTFPVYFDTGFSAAIAYQVTSLPATYFVDSDGNLVTYAIGAIDHQTLEKIIGTMK